MIPSADCQLPLALAIGYASAAASCGFRAQGLVSEGSDKSTGSPATRGEEGASKD